MTKKRKFVIVRVTASSTFKCSAIRVASSETTKHDSDLPTVVRDLLHELVMEIRQLEGHICMAERHIEALAQQTSIVERLRSVPGVGLLTAAALVAFIGEVTRFPSGRHFACYLGLTPREHSRLPHRFPSRPANPYATMMLCTVDLVRPS
jgi:transposase